MKKYISLILCLAMLAAALCACGKEETGTKTYTWKNLTITVPKNMEERKDLLAGTGFAFCLEGGGILVTGLRDDASNFSDMTAMEYARFLMQSNGINGEPEDKGGYVLIKHTAKLGTEYTYFTCIYKNGYEFWLVEAATYSSVFEKKEDTMLEIVTSGQID